MTEASEIMAILWESMGEIHEEIALHELAIHALKVRLEAMQSGYYALYDWDERNTRPDA